MQAQRPALVAEQRQKLNPRMLQSIKILAMPVAELTEEIQSELEANPALEVLDDRSELSLDSYAEAKIDDSGEDWGDGTEDYSYRRTGADEDAKHKFLEGAIALPETLQEHLLTQLRMLSLSPVIRKIGERLIQNLDEDGFHRTPPEELCPACSPEDLEQAMEIVRGLDPNGTCTKDYRESLLVQAALDPEAPEGVIEIMTAHLDKLEKGKHAEIRRSLKIKDPQIEEILAYIKTLSPFPGRAFSTEKTRYVVPDLAIRVENDEFVIELNDEVIPLLGINPFFSELSSKKNGPRDKDTVSFVKENIERAKFFIGSLQQRSQTLLKVAKVIAKFQARFFVEGPQAMQPLTLRDVADEVGVHETTVSRIANGKYVQTDWGILELRRFFTNPVSSTAAGTTQHSKESAKATLREILEGEDGNKPAYSDRELVDILAGRGIKIARRTVAKYRGELDMDSSFSRRKY
ncbi:MAG: RNA polymerase factor sigma-54 [Spirochaetia bacterium]|nr:RNA polymerase factor sigma-54 [Spirochaetia bacterium]MCE1208595.1 RNA polymerase factor sigma-54 [Spirochaetia bacterium]